MRGLFLGRQRVKSLRSSEAEASSGGPEKRGELLGSSTTEKSDALCPMGHLGFLLLGEGQVPWKCHHLAP